MGFLSDVVAEVFSGGSAVTETFNSDEYAGNTTTSSGGDGDGDGGTVSQEIKYGDTVSKLVEDNNTTIGQIKLDNPGIDINNIQAGETINITANTRAEDESLYTGIT